MTNFARLVLFLAVALLVGARAFSDTHPLSIICVNAADGEVFVEENADIVRPPASMVKLMVMLLVVEGVEQGKWDLDDAITASENARAMGGTQVYLDTGEVWELSRLMRAMAVASANDAAVAVAEGLWGSIDACLVEMNTRARELGMKNTTYTSVHGLPPGRDDREPDMTTARDMTLLARQAIRYPVVLEWTSIRKTFLREDWAAFLNTNRLLSRMDECDGLKTGYIRMAGFCIAATARRADNRVIAVVMGARNASLRNRKAQELMEGGLARIEQLGEIMAPDTEITRNAPDAPEDAAQAQAGG